MHTFRMWTDADSDETGRGDDYGAGRDDGREQGDDRAFWRRRFFILCGGVVALGVCAWLFPGAHQPSKREAAAVSASMAALANRQVLPSAATGPAWPVASTLPDPYPTVSADAANATAKAAPAKQASSADHPKPTTSGFPSSSAATVGACKPGDIVLSLFTSQPSYPKGAHPRFSIYAVSTSGTPCTLTYGAGSVQVIVTQHGHVVWDSAACKPAPAKQVRFTLGVPQVLTMVWNPQVTHPTGCAGSLPSGGSGTLDAVVMSHGQSSPVRAFKLSRLFRH
ncbi:MAG: hypothetical protein ACRDNW_01515 [Trebonia sp.]